jgi:hypothetical protein
MPRFTLPCLALVLFAAPLYADVRTVRVPNGGQVPDVVLDAAGTLHMTYGTGLPGDAFYVRSTDAGKTFTKPVQLNRKPRTVTTGMERGPRLALGKDGVIHALWGGYYQTGGGVFYTRSTDGGKTFEPERRLEEPHYGLDNLAMTADDRGTVVVLWTGGFPGTKQDAESPTAAPIILVRSTDNGQTFTKNELLKSDHPASGRACGCCRLEARIAGDNLYVAFRGGYKSIRDPWLLVGPKNGNDFRCVRVSVDDWELPGCPMMGIPLTVDADGRVLVSWMSRGRGYWSRSDAGAKSFAPKHEVPAAKGKVSYPLALPLADGRLFVLWQMGRAAQWGVVGADGRPTGPTGRAALPGLHKANAFRGGDGNVYVVY